MLEVLVTGPVPLILTILAMVVGMARVTADQYTDRWKTGLTQNTNRIREGIQRLTVSPTESAAKVADRALQKIIAAFQDGTWAAQLRRVSLEDWKTSAINKGLTRIAQGVEGADASQREMAARLLAAVDASVAEAERTPRGDLEANITRMTTFVRGMASRKLRRPGR